MADEAWHSELGFTERSTATLEIVTALRKTSIPPESHLPLARNTETFCFTSASSKAEYHTLLKEQIKTLLPSEEPNEKHIAPHLPPSSHPPIGRYTNPVLKHTTLSANIYRALAPADKTNSTDADTGDGADSSEGVRLVCLKLSQSPQPLPHNAKLEASILKSCSHPHILPYLDSFHHAQTSSFVLVTPWLGHSLSEILDYQDSGLPEPNFSDLKRILYQTTQAVAYLHSKDIIHRDIKPANILLSPSSAPNNNPHAYLIDFSISWTSNSPEPSSQKYSQVGTTSYRAPELLFGSRTYGPGIDLWALGCVVAQCCNSDYEPIFDSGELGTELALIASLFRTLGTPDEECWPECKELPDWGKVQFFKFERKEWREIVKGGRAGEEVWDLVGRLLVWESGERLKAEEVLRHGFFDEVREEK